MSLLGQYDDQNVFAKIMRGEMPCVKIFEDNIIISIMDAFPQAKGHVLVIPKAPSRNLLEMSGQDIEPLFKRVQQIAKAVSAALTPDGIIITQFNGAPAGQTVFHTHVHIIPRYEGTNLSSHSGGNMADMDELQKTANLIIEKL